ncbi:MAG: hypothetical protein G01um1014106_626, partial [Parcubacteria group bacterium Gr01-1014_106]
MDDLRDTTVIVLHFGEPAITEATLETLRRFYPNPRAPRVILVENGSPFPGERFPDMQRITLSTNRGYGAGNNRGIHAALNAGATYVVLL